MTVTERRKTRQVNAGGVLIGGGAPISVQTMTNAAADDITATIRQIHEAADAGCDLVRCAVPNLNSVENFWQVVGNSPLPVVADIHFDWRIAVKAIEAGAAKIRINPGNMGDWEGIGKILTCARERNVPIRIGVNGGSVKHKDATDTRPLEQAIVEEALGYARRFEDMGFSDIVLSLKVSDALGTIRINRKAAELCDYPLHIGVTEAGLEEDALLKSAIGIGALLAEGIGDTIRLSFTGEPVNEVIAAKRLLKAAGVLRDGVEIISCPTCGRCRVHDMPALTRKIKEAVAEIKKPVRLAVMGCEVNGPGEARDADLGIAGCGQGFVLFAKGEKIATVTPDQAIPTILKQIKKI